MLLLFRVEWTQGGNGQAGHLPGACTRKHSSPVQLHPWLLARQPPGKSATCQAQRRSGRYDRSEKRRETTTRSTGRCALALMVCRPSLVIGTKLRNEQGMLVKGKMSCGDQKGPRLKSTPVREGTERLDHVPRKSHLNTYQSPVETRVLPSSVPGLGPARPVNSDPSMVYYRPRSLDPSPASPFTLSLPERF